MVCHPFKTTVLVDNETIDSQIGEGCWGGFLLIVEMWCTTSEMRIRPASLSLCIMSLVFSSMLSSPSTVSSTTNSRVLSDVSYVQNQKNLLYQPPLPHQITSKLAKVPTEIIHPNVNDFPGLLLLVVLAIHSALNHQTT